MPFIAAAIGTIFSSISSFAGASFFGGLISGAKILNLIIGIGLKLLSAYLAKKKQNKQQGGFESQLQIGGEVPRQVILGRCATRGHLVYFNSYGGDNEYNQFIYVLSDSHCWALKGCIIDGKELPLVPYDDEEEPTNAHARYRTEKYDNEMTIYFYNGSQSVADGELVEHANPPERWTADDKLTGMCYVWVRFKYQKDKFASGIPEITWVVEGTRLLDPRLIESETHVWGQPDTYSFSLNPSVLLYNYLRGIKNYQGEHMVGLRAREQELLTGLFISAATCSDEDVEVAVPGGDPFDEHRYECSMIVTVDQEARDVIEQMVAAMAGFTVERGGLIGVIPGAGRIPIDTFTDDDLVEGQTLVYSARKSRNELANGVFGQFTDPGALWQPNSYPPILDAVAQEEDGEPLHTTMDLRQVSSVTMAQRIASIRLKEIRRQASAVVTLGFNKIWWEAGDWVTWSSARYGTSWGETPLRDWVISKRKVNAKNRSITFWLEEMSEDIYGWLADDAGTPSVPPDGPGLGTRAQTVSDFRADLVVGAAIPSIKYSWTPVTDQTIVAVIIERRIVETVGATRIRDDSPQDGEYIEDGMQPSEVYEARATIDCMPYRTTVWTDWVVVGAELDPEGTPTQGVTATDYLEGSIDRTALSAVLQASLAESSQTLMRIWDEIYTVEQRLSDALSTTQSLEYSTSELLKVSTEQSFAAVLKERNIRLTETTALYTALDAVVLQVEDPTTGNAALASQISGAIIDIATNASGITVLNSQYTALDSRITTAEGTITAQAGFISTQTTRVDQLNVSLTGTAAGGSANTITLQSGSSGVNNYYVGLPIAITSGPGAGQTRVITAYNGATRVATVNANWTGANPTSSSLYSLGNALGAFALSNNINTVSTTVDGHTSSITMLQGSYNGLSTQYSVLGDIDGVLGGFLFTGIKKMDGSVTYDFIIAADNVTIANLGNLIKNGKFDKQGAVDPAATGYDIEKWYIASGGGQLDVVASSGAYDTLSTLYCLRIGLGSTFTIYNEYNINGADPASHGFPITLGDKIHLSMEGNADASRTITVTMFVLNESGSVITSGSVNYTFNGTTSVQEGEFTATATGRGYFRISRSSTVGVAYVTNIEAFRKNGAKLIVDGTIIAQHMAANSITAGNGAIADLAVLTIKIAGNAVTVPFFFRDALTDNVGAGVGAAFQTSMEEFYTVYVPNGETFSVSAQIVCQMTGGSGSFEHKVSIKKDTGSYIDVDNNGGGVISSAGLIGGTTFTSTTSGPISIYVRHQWRGDVGITAESRSCISMTVKR